MVLILCRLDEIANCFTIIRKRNCHDGILVIILWRVEAKYIQEFLNKGRPILEKIKSLVRVWFLHIAVSFFGGGL